MSGLTATGLSFGEDCLTAHDRKSGAYSTASPEAQQVPPLSRGQASRFRGLAPNLRGNPRESGGYPAKLALMRSM